MIHLAALVCMAVAAVPLTPTDRQVFRLFANNRGQTPGEWAEANRVFRATDSAHPGRYRRDTTPYADGLMRLAVRDGIDVVALIKGVQIGANTLFENVLAWLIDNDPANVLLVKPTEALSDEQFQDKIEPLIKDSPALSAYLTGRPADVTKNHIRLRHMHLWAGWATSPGTLKSRACRVVFIDEPDDYPTNGSQGDAIALATDRTETFGDRAKTFIWGTPTTKLGAIWEQYELCDVRYDWHVPCPHCGEFQVLDFFAGMKWPAGARPDAIQAKGLAWYECAAGKCRIEERHRRGMNARGEWVSNHQRIDRAGRISGENPPTRRIGARLESTNSLLVSWGKLVKKYLKALGNEQRLMVFTNNLGRPFEQSVGAIDWSRLKAKTEGAAPPGVLPDWTGLVLGTADTQLRNFKWVVRAHGPGGRSRKIAHGTADTFAQLRAATLDARFVTAAGHALPMKYLGIDSGGTNNDDGESRTEEVYKFAERQQRIIAYKGRKGRDGAPQVQSQTQIREGKYRDVHFRTIRPDWYKNILARLIADDSTPSLWELNSATGDDYLAEMIAEHQVIPRGKAFRTWQKRHKDLVNDYFDCEVLQVALAEYAGSHALTPDQSIAAIAAAAARNRRDEPDDDDDDWRPAGRNLGVLDELAARLTRLRT